MTRRHHLTNKSNLALDELKTEERTLFDFLCLLVDIRYRQRYGNSIEWDAGRGYSRQEEVSDGETD
jgi:hypothetical protein